MEIEEKKDLASSWFRNLRDQFCKEFETLDGSKFERTKWNHSGSGGGEISLMKGNVFEKVGVNISTVSGEFKEDYRSNVSGTEDSPEYWASGLGHGILKDTPEENVHYFIETIRKIFS